MVAVILLIQAAATFAKRYVEVTDSVLLLEECTEVRSRLAVGKGGGELAKHAQQEPSRLRLMCLLLSILRAFFIYLGTSKPRSMMIFAPSYSSVISSLDLLT